MNIAICILAIAVIACSLSVISLTIRVSNLQGKARINELDMSHLKAGIMNLHSIIRDHKEKDHEKSSPNSEQQQKINEIRSGILDAMKDIVSPADKNKKAVKPEDLERFGLLMTALERFDEITGEKQPLKPIPSHWKRTSWKDDTK